MRCTPPRSSRVHCVFRARDVIPYLSSRIEGDVLALPSIQEGVTGLRVTAMCDGSMVVASVNKLGRPVSHSLCSLAGHLLRWPECLDLHLDTGYLPGQSYVLTGLLSRRGPGYRGSMVSPPAGGDWSAARLGLPVAGLVRDDPPRGASPMLFPHPESPGSHLGCILYSLGQPGRVRVPTLPHRMGGGLSWRDSNLFMTLVAPLWPEKVWFADLPLPLLVGFPVHLRCGKGLSVSPVTGSQSTLNLVFALQDLVRAAFREIFCVPSKFLDDCRS